MSRARCLAAILALATASPSAATAQTEASYFTNGNDLLADCADTTTATVSGCYAYLAGFVDGSLTAREKRMFCVPRGATLRQLRDIAVRELEARPEERHRAATLTLTRAYLRAFPCPPNAPRTPR